VVAEDTFVDLLQELEHDRREASLKLLQLHLGIIGQVLLQQLPLLGLQAIEL
jgi:hypothetical protein